MRTSRYSFHSPNIVLLPSLLFVCLCVFSCSHLPAALHFQQFLKGNIFSCPSFSHSFCSIGEIGETDLDRIACWYSLHSRLVLWGVLFGHLFGHICSECPMMSMEKNLQWVCILLYLCTQTYYILSVAIVTFYLLSTIVKLIFF